MKLLICPMCYSKNVELDSGGVSGKYFCKDCGYVGSFILEMSEGDYEEMLKSKGEDFKLRSERDKDRNPTKKH
ncbi:MAG: TFIIB-type zinc ribbon-containing protein [Archaeoglobi archaeon]|nr:TFIIB-type zinc ribbon-containing protein [Archaeoglobi archaeon]